MGDKLTGATGAVRSASSAGETAGSRVFRRPLCALAYDLRKHPGGSVLAIPRSRRLCPAATMRHPAFQRAELAVNPRPSIRARPFYDRLRLALIASYALIALSLFAGAVTYVLQDRSERLDEATRNASTLARALDEHVRRTFEAVDLLLVNLATDIREAGGMPRLPEARLHQWLMTRQARDTLARFGGEEFVVIVEGLRSRDSAEAVSRKIPAALAAPFDIDGHTLNVSASIGVTCWPGDGEDVKDLIRAAAIRRWGTSSASPSTASRSTVRSSTASSAMPRTGRSFARWWRSRTASA